jgi:hypothetical protein
VWLFGQKSIEVFSLLNNARLQNNMYVCSLIPPVDNAPSTGYWKGTLIEIVSQSSYTMPCNGSKLNGVSQVLFGVCRQARFEAEIDEQASAKGVWRPRAANA